MSKRVFTVEEIRAQRKLDGKYLIKWQDYDETENTWEPKSNILDKSLIAQFEAKVACKWQFFAAVPTDQHTKVGWNDFDVEAAKYVEPFYLRWLEDEKKQPAAVQFSVTRHTRRGRSRYDYALVFGRHITQMNTKTNTTRLVRRVPC